MKCSRRRRSTSRSHSKEGKRSRSRSKDRKRSRSRSKDKKKTTRGRDRKRSRSRSKDKKRSLSKERKRNRDRKRSRSKDRNRNRDSRRGSGGHDRKRQVHFLILSIRACCYIIFPVHNSPLFYSLGARVENLEGERKDEVNQGRRFLEAGTFLGVQGGGPEARVEGGYFQLLF